MFATSNVELQQDHILQSFVHFQLWNYSYCCDILFGYQLFKPLQWGLSSVVAILRVATGKRPATITNGIQTKDGMT